jgi:hypothetical protein
MKSLKYLSLAVPCLFVAMLSVALAADEKKDDKKDDKKSEKMEDNEYYPLKVGSVWHYKLGDAKFRLKATKTEDFSGKTGVRVEMLGDGDKVMSFEHILPTKDSVSRLGFEGNKAEPPVVFLKNKAGEEWDVKSTIGKEKLTGKFKTGEEKGIKVPAGEYDTLVTSSDDLDANGMKVSFKTYFAKKVGMVKQTIKLNNQEVVIELEKYEEGK